MVIALELLLMLMELHKQRGKSSQMLPLMAVFHTKCVKGTISTDDSSTCMCISVSTMCMGVGSIDVTGGLCECGA